MKPSSTSERTKGPAGCGTTARERRARTRWSRPTNPSGNGTISGLSWLAPGFGSGSTARRWLPAHSWKTTTTANSPFRRPVRFNCRLMGGDSLAKHLHPGNPAGGGHSLVAAGGSARLRAVFNGKDFSGWAGPVENYEVQEGAIVCKRERAGRFILSGSMATSWPG